MTRTLARLLVLAFGVLLALPAAALALAGGATGGGGGGGSFSGGGGGSGSSCTGDGCDLAVGIVVLIAVVIVGGLMLLSWVTDRRRQRRIKAVEYAAGAANYDDAYWDPAALRARVEECFFPIQRSWEARDVAVSRPFVSDSLYERHRLQLEGLEKQNRRNRIQNLKLDSVELVRVHNVTTDVEDRFVARIKCRARDWVEDTHTGELVNGSKTESSFDQFWSFVRHPQHGWVLDEIQQASEGAYHEKAALVNEDEGPAAFGAPAPAA